MKALFDFFRATLIGGVIFLVPFIVIVFVVGKALRLSMRVAEPLAAVVPVHSVGGIALANLVGLLLIMLLCFLAGLLARNSLASNAVREAETRFLWKIPAYSFVKGMTDSFGGDDSTASMKPVLAKLDDASQLAFEVERLADHRVVVYIPGAPDPWSGAVMVMTEDRIEPLSISMVAAVQNLRALGRGTKSILHPTA